jgi:hypothetical protein
MPKNAENFYCKNCDFICCKYSNYKLHLLTAKHQIRTNLNKKNAENYICSKCQKGYKARSGLWYHEKKCKIDTASINSSIANENQIVMSLLKENLEMKNLVLDVCKQMKPTIINNINSHNKTFNLNVFLNEHCKDAMNIMEFVDSLKIQLSDLESVGKLGFVNGISNIIVKNLNAMDIHKRPVHCSDAKREIIYVKDDNKWEKEQEENKKLRKAIKYIAHKNSKMVNEFRAKYPDCIFSDSNKSDQYNKLIIEAMGGLGDNDAEKEDKIIKNIAKVVVIDKSLY